MRHLTDTYAVVLAGGEGSRLRHLTTSAQGLVIPKQYCSFEQTPCLLDDAFHRAASVAMHSQICTVVASGHERWWHRAAAGLDTANILVQPKNRGTAFGILLALLSIELRNPDATVVLLPADHFFRDEGTIAQTLRMAANLAVENAEVTYLLGTDPSGADPELGYILPSEKVWDKPACIEGFKEKPSVEHAVELIASGALWNLFIAIGSVRALLDLFSEDYAARVRTLRQALQYKEAGHRRALEEFYTRIGSLDFSSDVLEVQAHRLQVIRVPPCGWTDLGTPKRVEAAVRDLATTTTCRRTTSAPLFFDLAGPFS